jgi:hypothetical protein
VENTTKRGENVKDKEGKKELVRGSEGANRNKGSVRIWK